MEWWTLITHSFIFFIDSAKVKKTLETLVPVSTLVSRKPIDQKLMVFCFYNWCTESIANSIIVEGRVKILCYLTKNLYKMKSNRHR